MSTPKLDLVGIVVEDMAETLAFYRLLGIDIPEEADTEPHVEVVLASGMRLAWDTVETIESFDPDYQTTTGSPRVALAFRLATPEEVDRLYAQLTGAGHHGHKEPWDAFWGNDMPWFTTPTETPSTSSQRSHRKKTDREWSPGHDMAALQWEPDVEVLGQQSGGFRWRERELIAIAPSMSYWSLSTVREDSS